ncbi:uncharacterized protein SPAPADRAFT_59723 [Spathaspora passalidarum NRRL Y-27907]|uniref:Uncharacterized protein n=1 Tax=Spathaspora passalidarum (strain NRRL Y-27907 / 11-Y1) TaxID=619300 RepID=G3AHY4_SPAPN|nr:uncharacterized protein SPAPADRAFT_59723 [Spathaspora passalidarum NRRL Y-27907]EGW34298.1 hypothetical protein SPAPADRAFT_59723 [Spathaspora passalidarum NRRL Y-27907]
MLIATGASVASAASLYSQNNDTTFKSVDSAISSILTLLLATKGSNNESRASSLGFPSAVDRGIVGSLSELNLQEKREPSSLLMGDLKRTRPNEDLGINYKSSVPGPAPFWGSTNSLKMPHYKKKSDTSPSPASDQQRVLKLPRDSPFISNKVHLGVRNDNSSSSSPGLRKPGSFQKPAIVKSEGDKARGTSLGFPRLYSASYS